MNKKFLENKIILLGLGITQREIAKQLNMAESYVSLLMSGKRKNYVYDEFTIRKIRRKSIKRNA